MFEILKKKGLSNHIYTPVTKEKLDLAGFAYVDDSDLFVLNTTENPETTKEKMQELLDAWEEASKVTGGRTGTKKMLVVSIKLRMVQRDVDIQRETSRTEIGSKRCTRELARNTANGSTRVAGNARSIPSTRWKSATATTRI